MLTFDHLRWHLALALGGALIIERLHGPFATGLVALIAVDRVATAAVPYLRRRRDAGQAMALPPEERRMPTASDRTPRPRPRPIALARALDADCTSCRGFGCRICAYTGLN